MTAADRLQGAFFAALFSIAKPSSASIATMRRPDAGSGRSEIDERTELAEMAMADRASANRPAARLNGLFRRFRKDRKGVTAVEFGIVAIPFFGLLLGIIEVALVFFVSQLLDSGLSEAARLIRTGQAQTKGFNEQQFRQEVCSRVIVLSGCEAELKLDVRTYRDFESTGSNLGQPIDKDGNLIEDFEYQPGVGGDIVLVRAFYEWPMIMPFGLGPGNLANGDRLLASTVAFRNEPF